MKISGEHCYHILLLGDDNSADCLVTEAANEFKGTRYNSVAEAFQDMRRERRTIDLIVSDVPKPANFIEKQPSRLPLLVVSSEEKEKFLMERTSSRVMLYTVRHSAVYDFRGIFSAIKKGGSSVSGNELSAQVSKGTGYDPTSKKSRRVYWKGNLENQFEKAMAILKNTGNELVASELHKHIKHPWMTSANVETHLSKYLKKKSAVKDTGEGSETRKRQKRASTFNLSLEDDMGDLNFGDRHSISLDRQLLLTQGEGIDPTVERGATLPSVPGFNHLSNFANFAPWSSPISASLPPVQLSSVDEFNPLSNPQSDYQLDDITHFLLGSPQPDYQLVDPNSGQNEPLSQQQPRETQGYDNGSAQMPDN